ncbi:MAG: glycosyltransferase [Bacillota bacterium]|nr:glycosyltransferase [Bacillota bacterium]
MNPAIGIVGHFAHGLDYNDGQTQKTRHLARLLAARYGADSLRLVDTHGWTRHPWQLWRDCRALAADVRHILILPAHNGVRVFVPFFASLARRHPQLRLSYVVIGGWLPELVSRRPRLLQQLESFHAILVETRVMLTRLQQMGLGNVRILRNMRRFTPLAEDALVYPQTAPWRFAIFSRLNEQKGITDAIDAVLQVNRRLAPQGEAAVWLNIYGPVEDSYRDGFHRALSRAEAEWPEAVTWHREIPAEKAIETLAGHFALLFPTRYRTEGIPGTIIDAYAAGLPVLASRWEAFEDVVEEGVTGLGYEFGSREALEKLILYSIQNAYQINAMRPACLSRSRDFLPESVLPVLEEVLA